MGKGARRRAFEILEIAAVGDAASRAFDLFIITLISLNVVAIILESVERVSSKYAIFFAAFEVFSVGVFSIEYVLRLWACTADQRYSHPLRGRIRYALTPLLLVDLMAVMPFYLPMVIPVDLRFLRALRLSRFFRLLKAARYSESLRKLGIVMNAKKEELFVAGFAVVILLVIASSFMYYIENQAQPEAFSSIPAAMWWGIATLTTVGYGDVYPVTPAGKIVGAVIAILGIGMFALPAGILASGFAEELRRRRGTKAVCPHCGKDIGQARETSD